MNIRIDTTQIKNSKDLPELLKSLTELFIQLQQSLQAQPNFLFVTSEGQAVPKNTPINTIVFEFDETNFIKTGYYDGEEIQIL